MKSVLLISLAFVVFFSSMARAVVVADFLLNEDYIAKVLCVNKDKPAMKCNGKCHLAKQLQKQDKAENTSKNIPVREIKEITGIVTHAINWMPETGDAVVLNYAVLSAVVSKFQPTIFHPPSTFI
jgi:hypothetical protein